MEVSGDHRTRRSRHSTQGPSQRRSQGEGSTVMYLAFELSTRVEGAAVIHAALSKVHRTADRSLVHHIKRGVTGVDGIAGSGLHGAARTRVQSTGCRTVHPDAHP